jgi:hypothetical protein
MPVFVMIGGGPEATRSYRTEVDEETGTNPRTWTSQDIGTAAADRHVVVGVPLRAAGNITISSVTVGGISATQLKTIDGEVGANTTSVDLWIAAVPTGTTASIVVTFSGAPARHGIAVWAVYGSTGTASASVSSLSNGSSTSLTVPAGGVAIGLAMSNVTGGTATSTATGLTEDFDVALGGDSNCSGMSAEYPGGTTLNVGNTWTSGSTFAFVAVALGP